MLATRIPATAGPIIRALLNIEELTRSRSSDLPGQPSRPKTTGEQGFERVYPARQRCQNDHLPTVMILISVKMARMNANTIEATWVAITTFVG